MHLGIFVHAFWNIDARSLNSCTKMSIRSPSSITNSVSQKQSYTHRLNIFASKKILLKHACNPDVNIRTTVHLQQTELTKWSAWSIARNEKFPTYAGNFRAQKANSSCSPCDRSQGRGREHVATASYLALRRGPHFPKDGRERLPP